VYTPPRLGMTMEAVPLLEKGFDMFALAALICFILAVFGVGGDFNIIALGLAFVAAHLLVGMWPFPGTYPWQRRA
jgi:hypothetical protein